MFKSLASLFSSEKSKVSSDLSGATSWVGANWKRVLGYAALWYVGKAYGPAAAFKAQAILKVLGF